MFGLGLTSYIKYILYVCAIVIIVLSISKPKYGLYFLIFLLPFTNVYQKIYIFPLGSDINDILLISILIGTFIHGIVGKKHDDNDQGINESESKYKPLLNKVIFLLIIYSILSLFVGAIFWGSGVINANYMILKNYLIIPILFFLSIKLIKTKREIQIVVLIMIIALFIADAHYFQNMRYRALDTFREDLRNGGIFTYLGANELAAFHTIYIFIPLGFLFSSKKILIKFLCIALTLFTMYPIAFLFSRGAYVALFAGLLFLGIFKSRITLITMFIILISYTKVLPPAVLERIQMTETEDGLDHASSLRVVYWNIGLNQFFESPIVGKGFNSSSIFRGGDLHNKYIEILAEQGILGILLFLTILFLTFKASLYLNLKSNDPFFKGLGLGTSGAVVACAVSNFFGDRWAYYELISFFFILMALVVNANRIEFHSNSNDIDSTEAGN